MHDFSILAALVAGVEARVFLPLGFPQSLAHSRPVVLVAGGNQHPAVLAREHVGRTVTFRLDASSVVGTDRNLGVAIACVRQTDVNGLALSRDIALAQGGERANGGVQRCGAINDWHTSANGWHAFLAGDHRNAGHGLADRIIANLLAIGAKLAVRRHIDHDNAWIQALEHVVPEAHFFDGAGPEVLQQHIGNFYQLAQGFLTGFFPEVHTEALFAAVVLHPVSALFPNPRRVVPSLLTPQAFDLDDLCPQPGEHLGTPGSCLMSAQIDDTNAFQRPFELCHMRHSLSVVSATVKVAPLYDDGVQRASWTIAPPCQGPRIRNQMRSMGPPSRS